MIGDHPLVGSDFLYDSMIHSGSLFRMPRVIFEGSLSKLKAASGHWTKRHMWWFDQFIESEILITFSSCRPRSILVPWIFFSLVMEAKKIPSETEKPIHFSTTSLSIIVWNSSLCTHTKNVGKSVRVPARCWCVRWKHFKSKMSLIPFSEAIPF